MTKLEKSKRDWCAWLKSYGIKKFLNHFIVNAHGAEGACKNCQQKIYLDLLEGGGVADWKTKGGDYGCDQSPDTCPDGVGGHMPVKL